MQKFSALQQQFAKHLKHPELEPAPAGLEERRLSIYRDLFFNNIVGFLSNGFPVLQSLYEQDEWLDLCRAFYHQHGCRSPYFVDISKEFVEFLANEYQPLATDPPFMAELAHYEWVELALSISKEDPGGGYWQEGKPYTTLKVSELAWLLSYQFPVHKICTEFYPQQADGPWYFVVCRDEQDEVRFTEIDQVNAYLLNYIEQQGEVNLMSLNEQMHQALPQYPPEQLEQQVNQAVQRFLLKRILVVVHQEDS
ncbi:putative DNA-binding domain-containing protein [Lacimicrobium sp. SS2-24]|uniref:HvfC family RiPP maturation protein n=1 Tax=Lacimicrobium sp. SS2-24 TaxID=2005569 RepID=UPI000B4ACD63|nr:putative DNA-binding domain-containing protein [Lacimicrobium sp. SS2-24]